MVLDHLQPGGEMIRCVVPVPRCLKAGERNDHSCKISDGDPC